MEKKTLHVVNIAFVLPYYLGGQFEYFKDKGIEFQVACTPSPFLLEYSQRKQFIFYPVNILRKINIFKDINSVLQLIAIIKKQNIDIVIGHTPKGGLLSMLASWMTGTKVRIYFRHGLMYETSTGLKKIILKYIERFTGTLATKIICVSNSVLEKSISEKLNRPEKNRLLNKGTCNGVDIYRFSTEKKSEIEILMLKNKYGIQESDVVIGYVGRLVKDKGIQILLDCWKKLTTSSNNLKLLLVGPFEDRDSIDITYKKYIENSDTIIHTGFIGDIQPFYQVMDIFILPSYREGFPTVVLEASAMSLPVITSRATGCIDSILENKTGIFCNITAEGIKEKIDYYLNNPEVARQHGLNGRLFVEENFSQEIIWQEIEKILV